MLVTKPSGKPSSIVSVSNLFKTAGCAVMQEQLINKKNKHNMIGLFINAH